MDDRRKNQITAEQAEQVKKLHAEKVKRYEIKKASVLMALVLVGLAVIIPMLIGILSVLLKKPTYSALEKRELASFPEMSGENLSDGSFSDDFDLFYADTFPFREGFIAARSKIKRLFGVRPGGKTLYSGDGNIGGGNETIPQVQDKDAIGNRIDELLNAAGKEDGDTASPPVDTQTNPEAPIGETAPETDINPEVPTEASPSGDVPEGGQILGEQRGPLYVVGDTALEIFGGTVEAAKYYSDTVNLHSETYKNYIDGLRVYCMVFPTHIEFAMPKADRGLTKEERPCIDCIKDNLAPDITFIDPYDVLKQKFNEGEYLYFRTDHHWTARGAYYAYAEFAKAAGFTPRELSSYSTGRIEKFLGTFYASTTDPALAANPDYVEYFDAEKPYTAVYYKRDKTVYDADGTLLYKRISDINNGYLCFTGGDQPYIKITTDNKNGRKIIVFKESYGNAVIPFLVDDFEEIHVADIRSFPYNSAVFMQTNGITDALFINSAMSASTVERIKNIENLLVRG